MVNCSPGGSRFLILPLLLLCLAWLGSGPAAGQAAMMQGLMSSAASDQDAAGAAAGPGEGMEAESIVERARAAGSTIIIVEPGGRIAAMVPDATPDTVARLQALAVEVRDRSLYLLAHAPDLPVELDQALARTGGMSALPPVLLQVALALLLGALVQWLIHRWAQPQMAFLFNKVPVDRAEKIAFLLTRGLVGLARVLIQALVAGGLIVALDLGGPVQQQVVLTAIFLYAVAAAAAVFFRNLLAIGVPEHLMLALTPENAHALYLDVRVVLWLIAGSVWIARTGEAIDLPDGAVLLLMAASSLISALACIWLTLRHRGTVATVILGAPTRLPSGMRQAVARLWHVPAILYFVIAWMVSLVELLLGSVEPARLMITPIFVLFGAIAFYGLLLLLADRLFGTPRPIAALAAGEGEGSAPARMPQDSSYSRLAERAAGWIAVLAALALVMGAWGLNTALFGAFWGSFWEIVLVVFLAWLAYEGARIAIDRRIAEEGTPGEQGEEGPRRGLSRLGTLLPLFRNFLLIAILTFAALVVLSAVGVNVTPLFAGAGVLGLAIGFGAQTLIRDVFSGAFFLIDDAFRIGEYIDVGSVKGTVERVSIRSMQMRHQTGTLHTIPFGEIKHLTNFARDWVVMKLPLRLTYDTDVDEVRKLIKKLGQELLEHPDIGKLFLQPLKSQGVFQMEDSAMIIRVKFMTRPGDQFQVRKMVYARIREVFAEAGIRFAHREVTVRVATAGRDNSAPEGQQAGEEGRAWELSLDGRNTIAGAALLALDSRSGGSRGGDDR